MLATNGRFVYSVQGVVFVSACAHTELLSKLGRIVFVGQRLFSTLISCFTDGMSGLKEFKIPEFHRSACPLKFKDPFQGFFFREKINDLSKSSKLILKA